MFESQTKDIHIKELESVIDDLKAKLVESQQLLQNNKSSNTAD